MIVGVCFVEVSCYTLPACEFISFLLWALVAMNSFALYGY